MSSFHNHLKNSVFYAAEKPDMLTGVIETLIGDPEKMQNDIVLGTLSVKNNTALSAVKEMLPKTVVVTNSKGVPFDIGVEWGEDTSPTFKQTTEGDYVLDGTPSNLPKYITNGGSKKVKVTIHVEKAVE